MADKTIVDIDRQLQELTWELLLEVMSQGERHGLNSDILTPYHTQLLNIMHTKLKTTATDTTIQALKSIEVPEKRTDWTPVAVVKKDGSVQTVSDIYNQPIDLFQEAIKNKIKEVQNGRTN